MKQHQKNEFSIQNYLRTSFCKLTDLACNLTFVTELLYISIVDGDEAMAVPKPHEDHSYSTPDTISTVPAEPVDAAVQVAMVSGLIVIT